MSIYASIIVFAVACSSSDTPTPPPQLVGVVALGAPLAGATVSATCSSGSTGTARSNADGSFSLDVAEADLPCLLQARGGRFSGARNDLTLHGAALVLSDVTITPLTELALANVFAGVVDAYPSDTAIDAATLASGQAYVAAQLLAANLGTPSADIFAGPFAIGDINDTIIEALAAKLGTSHQSLSRLVTLSTQGADWAEALATPPSTWVWSVPDTLVTPAVPADNPMSAEKVTLGRFLFYDIRLSGNGTASCATCHVQAKAFTDGLAQAVGSTGEVHPRSSMSLGNVAFNASVTWAHPTAEPLEKQLQTPMFGTHPVEMGISDENRAEILERFENDADYPAYFAAAFPGQDNIVSFANIGRAIAAFERTLLSGDSYYDRAIKGRGPALSASEQRGSTLFFTSANCFRCHGSFNFTDMVVYDGGPTPELRFHNTGLFNIGGTGAFPAPNRGIFEITGVATDMGQFRAPSLRNIGVTAPYMHDGSIATLADVLDFYGAGGRNITSGPNAGDGRVSPFKSDIVNGTNLNLTAQDKADIVAFLNTLTDDAFLVDPAFADPFATH